MRIKNILALILTFILVFVSVPFVVANAETEDELVFNDFTYEPAIDNGVWYAMITGYNGNDTKVVIPSEVNGIKVIAIGVEAFCENKLIESVVIPEGIRGIATSAFASCDKLTEITIPESMEQVMENAMPKNWLEKQPDGPVYIGKTLYAYKGTTSEVLDIKEGTIYVNDALLENSDANFKSINIPASVKEIEVNYLKNLAEINVSPDNEYFSSIDGVLYNKDQTCLILYPAQKTGEYIMPSSVTEVYKKAFNICFGLTSVTLNDKIEFDSENFYFEWFTRCEILEEINVSPDNPYLTSVDGVLYNKDQTILVRYPDARRGSFIIPSTVKIIYKQAFMNCAELTQIVIPESVTEINSRAFAYCHGLLTVNIPDSVEFLGDRAFINCSQLRNAKLSETLKTIKSKTFAECYWLTGLIVPESIEKIEDGVFDDCTNLDRLVIPESVYYIDENMINATTLFKIPNLVIESKKDTLAERYAEKNDINFFDVDDPTGLNSYQKSNIARLLKQNITIIFCIMLVNILCLVIYRASVKKRLAKMAQTETENTLEETEQTEETVEQSEKE